jgi:hypothetical protein
MCYCYMDIIVEKTEKSNSCNKGDKCRIWTVRTCPSCDECNKIVRMTMKCYCDMNICQKCYLQSLKHEHWNIVKGVRAFACMHEYWACILCRWSRQLWIEVEAEELHLKYFEKAIKALRVWWSFKKCEQFSKSKCDPSTRYLCFVFATEITN